MRPARWFVRVMRAGSTSRTYTYTNEQAARDAFDRQLAKWQGTHRRTGGRPPADSVDTAYLEPVGSGSRVAVDLGPLR